MAFGFKNANRFKRRLRAIAPSVRRAVRAELNANGDDLTEAQKRAAPYGDGDLQGSIQKEDVSTDRRIAVQVRAGGEATTRPVRKSEKGNAPSYDYALGQELGTEKMPANPFFYPPYRARRKKYKRGLANVAKKAARAAAKTT